MQITISFRSGFEVQGVVLSISEARLRVAIRDWDDAAEFQWRDGQWYAENRDVVQIAWPEPLLAATGETVSMSTFCGCASRASAFDWVN
jgi:hypothetical protein